MIKSIRNTLANWLESLARALRVDDSDEAARGGGGGGPRPTR